jgi:hypothetical protein
MVLNNFPNICKLEINSYFNLYTTTFLSDLLLEKYIYKNNGLINWIIEKIKINKIIETDVTFF